MGNAHAYVDAVAPKADGQSSIRTGRRTARAQVDYEALARFRHQLRLFLAFSEMAAQKAGLTPQQHQALLAIKGLSSPAPASVGDLARDLLIKHHTAVELVNRMASLDCCHALSMPKTGGACWCG